MRLCQAALAAGLDIRGARFTVNGEPFTAARQATRIASYRSSWRRAGVEAVPSYSTSQCGLIGYGCLAPEAPDELHLLSDQHVLVQAGSTAEHDSLPAGALLMSSLRADARMILLNVSMGD